MCMHLHEKAFSGRIALSNSPASLVTHMHEEGGGKGLIPSYPFNSIGFLENAKLGS